MKISTLDTGFFKLDGGAMFGVVPKRMWEKMNPPDEDNMCTWAMRCLLIEVDNRKIVIDTGLGNKYDDKFRSHFLPFGNDTLLHSLALKGLQPEEITDVLLTHLHFDHCGGALKYDENGQIVPVFPNAVYWSNEKHWDWASTPNAREAASFLSINFKPLEKSGQLELLSSNSDSIQWLPNIDLQFCFGHTEAMMVPIITTPSGKTIIYAADTMPSVHHIGLPFVMAYDIRPLESIKDKANLLQIAIERSAMILFEHDPTHEGATLARNAQDRIVADQKWDLRTFLG